MSSPERLVRLNCTKIMAGLFVLLSFAANASTSNSPQLSSGYCAAFVDSDYYRQPAKTIVANPSNWIGIIENANDGDEILLEDGVYSLTQYAIVIQASITLRGKSGTANAVVIQGKGNSVGAEALMVMASAVHIADLTVKGVRDHGISIQEGFAEPVVYNVNLTDIGSQHIKGNRPGPSGTIACSALGYTKSVSKGDYNGAIDIHKAINWTIRDNYIYNIFGDGSGCIIDTDCGSMWPGGEPAILLWKNSKNNTIERNTIVNSFRAIALGLGTPYSGGTVSDNLVRREESGKHGVHGFIEGDAGISLIGASDVSITRNRLYLTGSYPGQIEVQNGTGITIDNNVMSKPVWDRGNAGFTAVKNIFIIGGSHSYCKEYLR